MRALFAIATREYASFFRIPLGWIVVALFVCLSGASFTFGVLTTGSVATMRDLFGFWWWLLVLIAPAIPMKLISEEIRTGLIETSMTAPVPDGVYVVGKYLAAVGFLITMMLPTALFVAILFWLSRPDLGPIAAGYLGLLLLSMLYLAIGCMWSATTSSQLLAYFATLFSILVIDVVPKIVGGALPESVSNVIRVLSPQSRMLDFYRGLLDTSHITFFLLSSVWFLTIASVVLQSRRWR